MSIYNKVIWSEGMFLQPQHFQQHDRYLESLIVNRPGILEPYNWGITQLKIDQRLLALGKFGIESCRGILPDGVAFNIPATDKAPISIDIPEGLINTNVYLASPLIQSGAPEAAYLQDKQICRYEIETIEVNDSNANSNCTAPLQIGKLSLRLLLENDDRRGYSCLNLAHILESRSDHQIILDDQFLPPCMDSQAIPGLANLIQELQGLLHYRGEMLVQRLTDAGFGGIAEIADFMLLQLVNRYEPLFAHLAVQRGLHPEQLYSLLIQLMGELSTFTRDVRRPIELQKYLHKDLQNTFKPLLVELRRALSVVFEESAIALKLTQQQPGTWVTSVQDKTLLQKALFVIAVHAHVAQDTLRSLFPAQIKIAPVEQIRHLVNRALPGIDLRPLPVAPRQIPFHANFTYFELNREHKLWEELERSGGIALHIGGDFPGLKIEFWAIKEG